MTGHSLRRGGLLLLLCASLACRAAALTAMSDYEDGFATFYGAHSDMSCAAVHHGLLCKYLHYRQGGLHAWGCTACATAACDVTFNPSHACTVVTVTLP